MMNCPSSTGTNPYRYCHNFGSDRVAQATRCLGCVATRGKIAPDFFSLLFNQRTVNDIQGFTSCHLLWGVGHDTVNSHIEVLLYFSRIVHIPNMDFQPLAVCGGNESPGDQLETICLFRYLQDGRTRTI